MRSDSADDVRQNLVVGYVWEIPFGSRLKGVPAAFLKGWLFGGISKLRSGSPLRITQDGDILQTDAQNKIRPDVVYGVSPILSGSNKTLDRFSTQPPSPAARSLHGTTPRHFMIGNGDKTIDFSMAPSPG